MASIDIRKQTKGSFYYASVKRAGKWTWAPTGIEARGKKSEKAALLRAEEIQREIDEEAKRAAEPAPPTPAPVELCGPLLEKWIGSLTNRDAKNDEWRANKHLLPRFRDLPVDKLTRAEVVRWLRELRAVEPKLSGASQKTLLGLLSRFCAWLSADDKIASNPCRDVPKSERPKPRARDQKRPWLDDEEQVQALIYALGPRWGLAFAVGNRAGLRPGEVFGLRVGDVDLLETEGVLHVAHSYDGRVKEDRGEEQPTDKHPPLHDATIAATLLWYAEARREAKAKDEDRLFAWLPASSNAIKVAYNRAWREALEAINARWRDKPSEIRERNEIKLTWYECTRHTATSRALKNGARFEEVSAMLNHSSPTVTARYYNRHRERTYATIPTTDIGAPVETAKVLPMRTSKAS